MSQHLYKRRGFLLRTGAVLGTVLAASLHSSLVLAKSTADYLSRVKGLIIDKADKNYPLWRSSMSWYIFKPPRYPDTIVRASSEEDAINTVRHARASGQKLVVRSTGHNPARAILRDGGILLDLSQLREVEVDAAAQTAWIQPGIKAEELLHITSHQGLAFPAAHTGIVGLGGYLLGGGLGWNMPEYGIACRSILAAEVITADGNKVMASETENQDLLWALRGSGQGFFGAVVRYKLQLYPMHKHIKLNRYVIPLENLEQAMENFAVIGDAGDKRLETFIKVGRFYPSELPEAERDLVCTVGFFAFGDSAEESDRIMAPVTNSEIARLSVAKKENLTVTYEDLYRPPETDYSSPNRTVVENIWTDELGKTLLLLTEKMKKEPPSSPRSFLLGGWSFNSTMSDPTSCIQTAGRHYLSWYMIAEEEKHNEPNYKWMDESLDLVLPYSKGHYLNEIDTLRYPEQVQNCFSGDDWKKLAVLRKKYDPDAVFHTFLGHT